MSVMTMLQLSPIVPPGYMQALTWTVLLHTVLLLVQLLS